MALQQKKHRIVLHVSQFRPEELSVNLSGSTVIVEGHHHERTDEGGTVERHFVRNFTLPDNVKSEDIESHLMHDGLLTIDFATEEPTVSTQKIPIKVDPNWSMQPSKALVLRNPIPMWWF